MGVCVGDRVRGYGYLILVLVLEGEWGVGGVKTQFVRQRFLRGQSADDHHHGLVSRLFRAHDGEPRLPEVGL